ncbi:cysteine hydrolase [Mitsuaria sp. WAJ17]|uniref:cysteine hydrolase family protein n=1 Tax=Mitsuaria sp. WAJ17 TaxID=2761452 RepID=UPI0016030FBA|nr:cysteine hydrolase family protein [Mitsuaria sp. WAJ17]MBB2486173.1 cysteine hydrolase [Mitsuaria sp. WAJ17]
MPQALLIIDVQQALFDPPPFEAPAVIERINALAERFRAKGLPVFLIQHQSPQGALQAGSPGWAFAQGLQTRPSDTVTSKTTPDSFLRTPLEPALREAGVSHVAVCGYASEFCVDTTVRRAAALGFEVTLVADAHTTHDKPHAGGAQIRAHENATLPSISSFGPRIRALPLAELML